MSPPPDSGPQEAAGSSSPFERIRELEARVRELEQREGAGSHPLPDAEQFRATMSALHQGYCVGEIIQDEAGRPVDYRFVDVNDLFEKMTGLADPIGRTAYEMVPNLEPEWLATYSRVALDGETIHFQNGSAAMGRWFDVFAAPIEPHGRFILLFQDATERHQTQQALRESEERFRIALHRSGTVVFEQDLDRHFTWAQTTELSIPAESLVGRRDEDVIADPEEARQVIAVKDQALSTGRPVHEILEIGRDGERRWFDIRVEPRRNAVGEIIGLIGSAHDITQHIVRQNNLDDLNRRLIQVSGEADVARESAIKASRAKSDFLAAMSHDLRTPLNAIGGYVELLDMGIHGPVTRDQQDALRRIATNQKHLLALIDDILSFAQMESGRLRLEIAPFDVPEMVVSIDALVAPIAAAAGIAYTGRTETEGAALGDEERTRQILQNLVGNALKFTPAGGSVGLTARTEAESVVFEVTDTGSGIAPEMLESIFLPFYQIDRAHNRPKDGVGLGLAISRELAETMNGRLAVTSTVGQGCTFSLTLPRA